MSVLDKFLSIMKLDDEDEYEDDFFGDDEEFEETPKKSFFKKSKKTDYYDDEDDYSSNSNNKVTQMRQPSRRANMEVCVIKPTAVDDAREITETLLSGRTVILNLEGLDLEIAQRIIDFTSGSCYAISGNMQKISHYIFIITPKSVDISGDFQEILSGSIDVPDIQ